VTLSKKRSLRTSFLERGKLSELVSQLRHVTKLRLATFVYNPFGLVQAKNTKQVRFRGGKKKKKEEKEKGKCNARAACRFQI